MNDFVRSRRLGFTLIELIISVTVFGVLVTAALSLLARENAAFQSSMQRVVALRNANYALSSIEQDVRTAGINLPAGQPELVYLGDDVVAFTADNVTRLVGDPFAVFVDPDAPTGHVRLPRTPVSIAGTGFHFPQTTYDPAPGVSSPAELIVFHFEPDASTTRGDDYLLWRTVNGNPPERVARNLLPDGGEPFFSYLARPEGGGLEPVPDSAIPLRHTEWIHGSTQDTGSVARIDAVRGVHVRLRATNGRDGDDEVIVTASRMVDLPNVGFSGLGACGDEPILGTGLEAEVVPQPGGGTAVELRWNPATDEAAGERDVVRYAMWRRAAGATSWGDPFVSIPSGATTYVYLDQSAAPGGSYEYALAAQDCTPSLSSLATSATVTLPVS